MADRQVTADAPLFQCKSCQGEFPANAFYASNMARCKNCVKVSAREHRANNLAYYQSYDRLRYRDCEHRKELARKGAKSPAGLESAARSKARIDLEQPEKKKARYAIQRGLQKGTVVRGSACFFCAATDHLQAHHHDYKKPLDVFWLCPLCHGKLHTINGDFLRGGVAP